MSRSIVPQKTPEQLPLIPEDNLAETPFEQIRHVDADGEYWSARELQPLLEYTEWRKFEAAIDRAKDAIKSAGGTPGEVIVPSDKHVTTKQGAVRKLVDFRLSRYGCYMIAMSSDTRKEAVGLAQTYFAVQTRRAELSDQKKRLESRNQKVTSYMLSGHSEEWSSARVDTKESQKALNSTLSETHETHQPDYARVSAAQNSELFNMTKREIVSYLGLLPKDEPHYRDRLGKYALQALDLVNKASQREITKRGRALTSEEQVTIVRDISHRVADVMREVSDIAGVDFVSGTELNDDGNALINRNVRLLE